MTPDAMSTYVLVHTEFSQHYVFSEVTWQGLEVVGKVVTDL